MHVGIGTLGLSLLAGALSTLSPCVLPLLPIVLGAAVASHRRGPLALAAGLALSFTVAGVALGSVGLYFGLDQSWLRKGGAVMLLVFGVILLSNALQSRLADAMTGLSFGGNSLAARLPANGLFGQFMLGVLLVLVWAPCVGPTLGVAATLAIQNQALAQVTLVMLVFGIGAALPLALVGSLSREALQRSRASLMRVGATGKYALGAVLLIVGISILTGLDKRIEAVLVTNSPAWLTDLTTRF